MPNTRPRKLTASEIRAIGTAVCERCKRPLEEMQVIESYAFPHDGRWVHSVCVQELLAEILHLLAARNETALNNLVGDLLVPADDQAGELVDLATGRLVVDFPP